MITDINTIRNNILSLSIEIVVLISFIYLISLFLRSLRFWVLVNAIEGKLKLQTSVGVTLSSYFLSTFLPARLGDGIKIIRPKKKYLVPYTSTGLALMFEKILDIFCISFILSLAISIIILTQNINFPSETIILLELVLVLEILGFLFLTIVFYWGDLLFPLFYRTGKFGDILILVIKNYKTALKTFLSKYNLIGVSTFITIIIWLIDSICLYLVLLDIMKISDSSLFFIAILSALFGYMTFAFPLSPGNIGSYELAVTLMFVTFFPALPKLIISAALIEHGLKTLIHLFFGGISTFYYSELILEIFENNSKV